MKMPTFPTIQSKMMPLFNKAFPTNVIAFTSDHSVDFTLDGDQHVLDKLQREFLFSKLNLELPEPIHIRQVHDDRIITADNSLKNRRILQEADGLITQTPGLPLAIRSADCLSVFLYDEKRYSIGLIHVGWKGSQKNIVGQTIKLMNKQWQTNPKDIKIAFGPAIRSCCYEVGSEFQEFFPQDCITRDNRYYLDLSQMTHDQLLSAGVEKRNIFDCDICTCCDLSYFSFRREGNDTGRMISIMMIKK